MLKANKSKKMSVEEEVLRIQKKLNKMTSEDGSVRCYDFVNTVAKRPPNYERR